MHILLFRLGSFWFICISNKGDYIFASIGLSVCLLATLLKKNYEQIVMKFYEGVLCGKNYKWLNFGSDLDHDPTWQRFVHTLSSIIVVACPD